MAHTQNFHVPLPRDLYAQLREESERSNVPATDIAREAIRKALAERAREAIDREIEAYIDTVHGTPCELDRDLEAAALESWDDLEPWEQVDEKR